MLDNLRIWNTNVSLYRQAYAETTRSQWVKEWPGQVVLCTSQIFWTLEVHEAIRAGAAVGFYTIISSLCFFLKFYVQCNKLKSYLGFF